MAHEWPAQRGDTGWPAGTAYPQALAEFARQRWGWDGLTVERTALVPDVMHGVVEALRVVTEAGDAVVVNCPVYPPFYEFVAHAGRRIVKAPLSAAELTAVAGLAQQYGVRVVADEIHAPVVAGERGSCRTSRCPARRTACR